MAERDTLDSIPINPGNTLELAYKDSEDEVLLFPRGQEKTKVCLCNSRQALYQKTVMILHLLWLRLTDYLIHNQYLDYAVKSANTSSEENVCETSKEAKLSLHIK